MPVGRRAKLTPHIILEGTRLTRKTDVAFALNEHPRIVGPRRYRYHSPLVSAEWCGFSPYPWGHGLIDYEPADEARAMEAYATWCRLFELLPFYRWIVDRFHLSTRSFQLAATGRDVDFGWLEERLRPLGFHVALLTRRPELFAAARAERVLVSGKPSQYDDLAPFVAEQERLRGLAAASLLPVREFDISDDDIERTTGEIADWLESDGGLWAPGG